MSRDRPLALALTACLVACAEPARDSLDAVVLTPHVRLAKVAGKNVVCFDSDGQRLLVDASAHADSGVTVSAIVGDSPPRFLVRCHRRGVLVGPLPAGTVSVAHANSNTDPEADSKADPEANKRSSAVTFRSTLDLRLGTATIHCYHKGTAWSDCDCLVYFPEAQVLVVGQLSQPLRHADVDPTGGTDLRAWARVLLGLHKDFSDADRLKVVPARGDPGGLELLLDQVHYLEDLMDLAGDAQRRGLTLDEMIEDSGRLGAKHPKRAGKPGRALLELAYESAAK